MLCGFLKKIRLTRIFVSLTGFVKRGVVTLVDEIPRCRNYHYYYYCCCYYYLFLTGPFTDIFSFQKPSILVSQTQHVCRTLHPVSAEGRVLAG